MVPSVRRALQTLRQAAQGPLVFPGRRGGVLSHQDISEAFHETLEAAGVARTRFHDCRHVFASLLIAAGKNVKYIATQMGHHSAAFTLDTYGHLMDRLPVQPVEWIDDLVFPEGFDAALRLHMSAALSVKSQGTRCNRPTSGNSRLMRRRAISCGPVRRGAWWAVQDSNLQPWD